MSNIHFQLLFSDYILTSQPGLVKRTWILEVNWISIWNKIDYLFYRAVFLPGSVKCKVCWISLGIKTKYFLVFGSVSFNENEILEAQKKNWDSPIFLAARFLLESRQSVLLRRLISRMRQTFPDSSGQEDENMVFTKS